MSQSLAVKHFIKKAIVVLGVSAWVLLGLFGFSLGTMFALLQTLPDVATQYLIETTPGLLILTALQYIVTLSVVVLVPLLLQHWSKREWADIKKLLGIIGKLDLRYVLIIPAVWGVYIVASSVAGYLATFVPGFNANQVQNLGFDNLISPTELVLAFIALVVLAPLAEEALFRGYLFGKLRAVGGFWLSTIVTSIVFGIAHQQWNVGLDVFVLSLFLCALREKTGNIWASVLLHGFKNSIAYVSLFILPLYGIQLSP